MSSRRRIDWIAAKAAFVGDPTRSFGKIARRFGVSDVAVGKHARADNWQAAADKFDREAALRALQGEIKSRDEMVAAVLRARDLALDRVVRDLLDGGEVKLADLPNLVKLAELLTGGATERPDIDPRQVQQVLAIVLQLGQQGLPRQEFLARFDRAVAGVLVAGESEDDGA